MAVDSFQTHTSMVSRVVGGVYINDPVAALVKDCVNFIVNALDFLQSFTKSLTLSFFSTIGQISETYSS